MGRVPNKSATTAPTTIGMGCSIATRTTVAAHEPARVSARATPRFLVFACGCLTVEGLWLFTLTPRSDTPSSFECQQNSQGASCIEPDPSISDTGWYCYGGGDQHRFGLGPPEEGGAQGKAHQHDQQHVELV